MEGGSGGGGGDGEGDGGRSWFRPRGSVKRNFSTMSASHRDDSPNSLFLPPNHDPHYDNEHSTRRRRIQINPERHRERSLHYPGDGLDFRRPVMSTSAWERSMGDEHENGDANALGTTAVAPAVIDLTGEHEDESVGLANGRGDGETAGASEANMAGGSSRATRGQRLPRFGRDVIDVEEPNPIHHHNYNDLRPRALESEHDDDAFAGLPGANFLALPPRRSASGRVQYSTLRRPTRPPSPPPEMDDEEIEYIGSRSFADARGWRTQERRARQDLPIPPHSLHYARPRSVTPYPGEPHVPVAIDLTDDADDDDDDVQIVNERRIRGVNLDRPELGAGHRTQAGEPGGFGIGRLAGLLREGGAALGGRLAQRVQDYNNNNPNAAFEHMDDEQVRAHRARLEQQLEASRERRYQHQRELAEIGRPQTPGRHGHRHRQNFAPRVRVNAEGTIPGYQRGGWRIHTPVRARAARPAPFLGDLGGMMDYGMAAFDMGYGGNDNPLPTPKYSPPPEPAEGFTRNPAEDEVVVCPNCGDELAVGAEEAKQEIWVVKGCGHAYCGDCAQHRAKTKSKKGKDRAVDAENLPPPFKNCVVDGCGKSASAKSMVRVYFGS